METDPVTEEVTGREEDTIMTEMTDTVETVMLDVEETEENKVTVVVDPMKRVEEEEAAVVLAAPDDLLYTYSLNKYHTINLKRPLIIY
jgi:hypothetical protein